MRYFIHTRLSEHISTTPEGYLLCRNVPIARTGMLSYAADELPEDMAPKGQSVVCVRREAADLFTPSAVASYEGKPLTLDHPEDFVHPDNFREESRGHVQNVRRGTGSEDDLLLADILVMDEEAIALVRQGLRELSCGYDADYEELRPGEVRQVNFVGNHVALVDRGRCGPRCAIKDARGALPRSGLGGVGGQSLPVEINNKAHEGSMGKSFFDRIWGNPKVRRAVRDAEAEEAKGQAADNDPATKAQDEDVEAAPATDNADLVQKLDEITLLLRSLVERQPATDEDGAACDEDVNTADEDPAATQDEEPTRAEDDEGTPAATAKTGDRRRTADADTLRRAAQLAPALRFHTGDSAGLVQRAALRAATRDAEVARVVTACLGRHTVDSAPPNLLNAAFVAASAVKGRGNSRKTADALTGAKARDNEGNTPSPSSINQLNRDFYKK